MPQSIFEQPYGPTTNIKMAGSPSQALLKVKASSRPTKHGLATALPRRSYTRLVATIRSWRARLNRLKQAFRAPRKDDADDRTSVSPMSSPKISPRIPMITVTPPRADMTDRVEERAIDEEDAPMPSVHAVVEEQLTGLIEEVFWDAEEDLEVVESSPRISFDDDDDEAQDFAWAGDEVEDFRLFVTAASYGWF